MDGNLPDHLGRWAYEQAGDFKKLSSGGIIRFRTIDGYGNGNNQ
jgi:hypothetical protein